MLGGEWWSGGSAAVEGDSDGCRERGENVSTWETSVRLEICLARRTLQGQLHES